MAGTGTDELEGAEDVRQAKEELKVLHDEKRRTEKIRATVKKELDMARAKTRKYEEVKHVTCFLGSIYYRTRTYDHRIMIAK